MRELVPLTNAVAAMMIRSVLSGCGGEDAILAGALTSMPTPADGVVVAAGAQADVATEAAAMVNTQAARPAKSAAGARAASPTDDRSREHHSARWLLAAV
jgi:hypothetical protein